MITVPEAAETIIKRSRYLQEALSKNLINYSSLARYIKPELESMVRKPVSNASVLMAVQRLGKEFKPNYASESIFRKPLSFSTKSNLTLVQADNTGTNNFLFSTTTEGKTVGLIENIDKLLAGEKTIEKVSAITIDLPEEAIDSPATFYFFLKSFAWEGLNILEVFATFNKLTLVVNDGDLRNAIGILQSLWNELDHSIDSIV